MSSAVALQVVGATFVALGLALLAPWLGLVVLGAWLVVAGVLAERAVTQQRRDRKANG